MHKQRLNYKSVEQGVALARTATAVSTVYRGWRLVAVLLAFSGTPVAIAGEQTDITFVVAGKTSNHRQHPDGRVDVLNYHFFAEIFLQDGGRVSGATLLAPTRYAEPAPLLDEGYALEHHGGRYATETELEATYPDGDYLFDYTAASVGTVRQVVKLHNPHPGSSGLPPAPRIFLSQAGRPVEPIAIDPEVDLQVSWSAFNEGGADPGGIMDDLVFVIMADCNGVRRAHSGRPFENTPFLSYADSHFDIAASQLLPASVYQLSVEHAVLDTSREQGVIGFATFATTTFLDLRTTGEPVPRESCQTLRQPFDAGQTDFVP
jgi:hypothetical protein